MTVKDEKQKQLPEKIVSQLFERIQARYGNSWANRFGNANQVKVALFEWGVALYGYSSRDMGDALIMYGRNSPRYAPNLDQFIECCKSISQDNVMFLSEPDVVKASSITQQRCMEEIKKYLS